MAFRKTPGPAALARPLPPRGDVELIYGHHPVAEALSNPRRRLLWLKLTRNAAVRLGRLAEPRPGGLAPEIVAPADLDRLAGADAVHQGMVLAARPLEQPILDEIDRAGLVVLLDQVTDPHNVGAILRSCAAFAVTALVTTARHSPDGSAVLTKAASGAVEHVPLVKVTNLARAIDELKSYGFTVIGLDSEAGVDLAALPLARPLALVLGAEGRGLRQLTRATCDHLARLDLPGRLSSLNVSNACALALHTAHRQEGRCRPTPSRGPG